MRRGIRFIAWALAAALFVGAALAAQLEAGAREQEIEIRLDASGSAASGAGVEIEGSLVAVRAAGVYRVTGSLPEGQLRIDVNGDSRVALILDGAEISNSSGPALLVENAGLATVELAEGSVNRLRSGAPVEIAAGAADADASGGALHAKDDLTITGGGALEVGGYRNNGIHCSNRLTIEGGEISVEAVNNGVKGKDGVRITGGALTVRSGGDGIESDAEDGAGYGTIELAGGDVDIESFGDGAQAATELIVSGGELRVSSGGGSAAAEPKQSGFFGRRDRGEDADGDDADDAPSRKGLKAGTLLAITGGSAAIDAAGDALHSDGDMLLSGGELTLASGDDGAHAGGSLTISGGELSVSASYEGLEANQILISGGEADVTATDDGVNANGGADRFPAFGMRAAPGGGAWANGGAPGFGEDASEGGGFARRGMAPGGSAPAFQGGSAPDEDAPAPEGAGTAPGEGAPLFGGARPEIPRGGPGSDGGPAAGAAEEDGGESLPSLRVTGGRLHVNAEGDGLDSNGDLWIEGGEVIVDGPSRRGNGALDFGAEGGGACRVSGGTVLAIGASGMAEGFDADSAQPSFRCDFDESLPAGSEIRVADAAGGLLFSHVAAKDFSSLVFSCPELRSGEVYLLSVGDRTVEVEPDASAQARANGW